MNVRIALVEDNPSLRKRFLDNFKYFPQITLVLVASSGEEFLEKVDLLDPQLLPEAVLMDIELPGINGIETTSRFKEKYPHIDVLMLTVFEDKEKIFSSINAGAVGYLLKDESPQKIIKALEELKEGGAPMSPSIARKLLVNLKENEDSANASNGSIVPDTNEYNLSEREIRIIEHLVQGLTYIDIAEKLFLSPHTVKTHIKNIYKKMHVHSRATVVKMAIEKKIL